MMQGFPRAYRGMRVGLFGGSFDPAHAGHRHVATTAQKRLRLDCVWWMVTPQNPLKPKSSPLVERVASAKAMARGAHMVVTDLEERLGARYTYETIRALKRLYPGVDFFLVMGGDNLTNFRRWKRWREVADAIPVVVVSRPGIGARERLKAPKDWIFLNARLHGDSSTALRKGKPGSVAKPKRK
jgi:nicotinate-nucleotide adenylyltransferase